MQMGRKWNCLCVSIVLFRICYKGDINKGLSDGIIFKLCTMNSDILRLIANNFTAPVLPLLMARYCVWFRISKSIGASYNVARRHFVLI